MYELIQVGPSSYYIQCPAKIGLFRLNGSEVCLIDSGSDKDAGRKVRQILDANGWSLTAIYNTHSNADHIGGNKYLQGQTGCRIYASGMECVLTRHTILEPALLYGGYPCRDLRHKFLLAQESDVSYLTEDVLPEGLQQIPLPGHFFDMVGFRTADDVVYLADCLSSLETLEKYRFSFIYDVPAYLETLERVKSMSARYFVPAHAAATEDIAPLAQANIDQVHRVEEQILDACAAPICFENLLQRLFTGNGLTLDFQQYVLVGSTIRSYLSWLRDTDRVTVHFADNMLLWERV